ncbi:MAG: AMP-binding protein [Pseudomonadota bacterium]
MSLEGYIPHAPGDVELYLKKGWWSGLAMGDMLDRTCDLYADKEGLVDRERRYTYGRVRTLADNLAHGLLGQGLEAGDRVLLQLPNWAEFVISYFALQKAGLVMVLLTLNHSPREILHLAELTQPRGWILPAAYRDNDFTAIMKSVRSQNPGLDVILTAGAPPPAGCLDLNHLMMMDVPNDILNKTLADARPDPAAVCQILPSGGTTGLPKGAARTHNDYYCNVEYVSKAWELNPGDNCLVASTVGHNLALLVTVCGAVFQGAKLVMLDSSRPEDFCRLVQQEKITATGLAPTLISRVIKYEGLRDFDLSSLRRIYVGAANSPPDLVRQVEEKTGGVYVNAFGMVEGPCAQSRPYHSFAVRTETIGLPTCPYDDLATLDIFGARTPRGVEGELAAKGPCIFSGYFKNPRANQSAFTPDGYFRTGDLAVIDPEGRIRITGRIKDIIIRGGENISARDVEDLLSTHPQVEYVSAIGIPDADLGETVCVFIKPAPGGGRPDREEIIAHMRNLGAAKALIPTRVEFLDEIPLTAAGKADKRVLKTIIENKMHQEADRPAAVGQTMKRR